MRKHTDALKLALEALEILYNDSELMVTHRQHKGMKNAITAIKEALAQPEQEPVAWFRYETFYEYKNQLARCTKDCIGAFPVYTSPPQRKPLTDEELFKLWVRVPAETEDRFAFARAIEAAHGIKEQNT